MSTVDLLSFWPLSSEVTACIKTDAESASEAVTLAVHQPMSFERRVIGADSESFSPCDEHDLLRAFVANDLPDGRVILPIVGNSGIGKSHVIRWLGAQIQRMPGCENRVLIRIPKGMSLKGVLRLLLEEMQGAPYEEFRKELTRAQEALEPTEAAGLLCEMLAQSLTRMCEDARSILRANPGDPTARERDAYCRPDMLPALFRNQILRDQHFVRRPTGEKGVVARLVEQLTEGRSAGDEDDRLHVFSPDDLLFSQVERDALGRAEVRAIDTFQAHDDRRGAAVRILNLALDDAKQRILRLDPTILELFDAVRKELLADGKELILLIEDFAVLSGLQRQLLQVVIKEAIRDGQQQLCVMRTALAYTSGYLDASTVLTRANVEYCIADAPGSEQEILARIERLVGAYLNAARLGHRALERAYEGTRADADLRKWVPHFSARIEPESKATIEAFGSSCDGYDLFPFNRNAIDALARDGCQRAGRLIYNPRFVIQNVINNVLNQRALFESGDFPSVSFGSQRRTVVSQVSSDIRRRVPPASYERYVRLLTYWGGEPERLADVAHIGARVFAAFGLDRTHLVGALPEPPRPTTRQEPVPPPKDSPEGGEVSQAERRWKQVLEEWRAGQAISQADANSLRKLLAEALKGYINWDWALYRPRKEGDVDAFVRWIYIPNAGGGEGRTYEDSMVGVCTDGELANQSNSDQIVSALMALIRFHEVHEKTWNYDRAEEDLPRYYAFLEALSDRARVFARRRYFRDDWDPAATLAQGLLIGARALGVDGAGKDDDHAALINALFAPAPGGPVVRAEDGSQDDPELSQWRQFKSTLRHCRQPQDGDQVSWQEHLLNLVGARQGGADTVHAVDALQLKQAIESVSKNWAFEGSLPNPAGVPEFASIRANHGDLKRQSAAVAKMQQRLYRWHAAFTAWTGDDSEKDRLVAELKATVEIARASGLAAGADTRRLTQVIEDFRGAKVVPALDAAKKLGPDAPRGTVLSLLGGGNEAVESVCNDLKATMDQFVTELEDKMLSERKALGDDPVGDAIATLTQELDAVARIAKECR